VKFGEGSSNFGDWLFERYFLKNACFY